ncbi:interleukin-21, partial [Tamandua tetradactyla]|uniref:interleukin-21 n=1 Tax=Tamandua tetradactyla TaxID=48850 RepID=UPI004054009B
VHSLTEVSQGLVLLLILRRSSPGSMERIAVCLILIFSGTMAHRSSSQKQDRFMIRMRQLIDIVDQLKHYVHDLDPGYLPAPQDVKRHCDRSAFSCFQSAQLKSANAGDNEKRITTLIKQLKRKLPPTSPGRAREHGPVRLAFAIALTCMY